MIGVRIPHLCTSVSSNCLRFWFRQIDVGTVSTITFDNLHLGTATQSANVYFRKLYDIPRTQKFLRDVEDPNTKIIYLYKKQMLEFEPIIEEDDPVCDGNDSRFYSPHFSYIPKGPFLL